MELTPERRACLQVISNHNNGSMNHDDSLLAQFCDDASTQTKPDVFNECHAAGWLVSSHDNRTDSSIVRLTGHGRTALAHLTMTERQLADKIEDAIAKIPAAKPGYISESFPRFRTHIARMREHGNTFCGHAPDLNDIEAMMAEIERLRAALKGITIAAAESSYDAHRMKIAAMRALEQRGETKAPSRPGTCVDGEPNTCTQPFNWDDGVPYCDTCDLYRDKIARNARKRRP